MKYDSGAEAYFQTLCKRKIRIGTQDLKIAAIALNHDATVVTRNKRDFERIPSLKIEDWSAGI
ncbi:MAG: type II toxin-antitoxin system VapC family toxin [Desulfobacteraceae bacterium]|nr:type II toxin-antitoxin system VapC family toxin [Desulfobacteraceae bacterium]